MIKPVVGHATLKLGPEADPLPAWREALGRATPEGMIKLLVDLAAWAQQHPNSAPAWTLLGDAYLQIGQPKAAEKSFTSALASDPGHARAREGLGLSLLKTAQPGKAAQHFAKAHQLAPADAEVLIHWGLALMQSGQLKPAHNRFKLALERAPDHPQAWLNLGVVDTQRGAWPAAIANFRQAIERQPDLTEAHHNLALVYRHTGELDQALACARHLTALDGATAGHWVLLAELLLNAGQTDNASTALDRAAALDPGLPGIYLTRALLYAAQRQYADAEGVLTTALVLSRDDPNLQLEMGHLHLLRGSYDSGWDLLEARKHIAHSPVRRFALPDWQGEDLSGQTVLVHAEQGLGDTILFASCLPDLLQRAGHVVIEVSARLAPLFARSFPSATVVGRDPQSPDMGWLQDIVPPPSRQIPIGSLPKHFRRSLDAFPAGAPFLQAAPERVAHWRQQLGPRPRPVVGLAWRGGLMQTGRAQRSLLPAEWAQALKACDVDWVSLQYGDAASDIAEAAAQGLTLQAFPEAVLYDQDECAALTCALDAVVTVCSTQAHLTGALGRPGFVLTPFSPNWRYGATGNTMPWYASLRLLRQSRAGDWQATLSALPTELAALRPPPGTTPC